MVEATVAADLYFVRSGSFVATVLDGKSATEVGRMGPGEVIGESQLIAGGRRIATVRALEKSVVLHLPAAGFDALAAASKRLRQALANIIHQRLREAALRLALPRAVGSDPELLDILSHRASWVLLRRGEVLWVK
ncbi:MAG: CRP-like cAMP-binding protein [Gammaproteobacteria bacterium]|jgi:CRP-like cAMP-binding protein